MGWVGDRAEIIGIVDRVVVGASVLPAPVCVGAEADVDCTGRRAGR